MKNLHNALLLKHLYQLKELGYKYTSEKVFSENDQNLLKLPNSLIALKQQAFNCHLCSLSKSRNQVVFGEGDENAEVMFIGDVPLEIEDNEGKPFLGRGGEMLTAMIEKVLGLSRENVYISNLLKCHPLASQEVHESEFHTCKAYLFKEIKLVNPKIIITLGEKAYHYLSNDTHSLTEIRGTIIQKEKHIILPTYHPNFLLKNPSFKKEVFKDLQKVKKLL
ncbi:MAG: Uracil-DNA glycosylase, family 4 [uncultured Sulfurovum sp.]|uniref:Type-4 uracil-DNA glycosylase n=1 Tax=uncultured Sulfurovum sp. TaxID=269237 RepID=A0A6S6SSV5_9BACT|nr:MAG: Uracil-DNA glycosylase, family 4 [uncultured Sulfurovum sp.]